MGSEPHHGHWSSNGTTLNVSYDAYVFPGAYPYQFGEPDELALDFEGHVPATFILLRRD